MTRLSGVLRANAASCIGFGALFILWPAAVSAALGSVPPAVLSGLGALLLLNGAHLLWAARRQPPRRAEVLWFAIGDFAWWLMSLGLVAAGLWITTSAGIALTLLVATGVALFGVAQLFLLGQHRSGLTAAAQGRRILRSWAGLPAWVRLWLVALNAVFLAAPVLLPWDVAGVVLIAYVATAPLLAGFAVVAGGMTRAMGIGHLVPWTPLLIWLAAQMPGLAASPVALGHAGLLACMVALCLGFDLYDLRRWLRGERAVLPPPQAPGAPALP